MLLNIKNTWFYNIRSDALAGFVVALALIPESIAFSIIAGVDPKIGIYSSFIIPIIIAFAGGRPAMISAATGAMSLVIVTLVKDHGLQYLLAASLLTGLIQILIGIFKLGNLMRFISRSVVTGFINSLAILMFLAQLNEFKDAGIEMYIMTAAGLGIIYLFPYLPIIGKAIPSSLICIIVITIATLLLGWDINTVGDKGELPSTLPIFLFPDVPFTLDTLKIILPYSLALSVVGLLESLMTATILDDLTKTTSNKNRECVGQGIANIGTSILGGMAGCAMIGQSIINVKSGGRSRLSTLAAGVFLLLLILFFSHWLVLIPMAALVAVMIMVCISAFSWRSLFEIKKHPLSSNIVMVTTVFVVIFTHNLAIGVLCGVLLSGIFFANKVSKLLQVHTHYCQDKAHYEAKISGQIFFASSEKFINSFDYSIKSTKIFIDLTHAHFWDITALSSLEKVIEKYNDLEIEVELIGMNEMTKSFWQKINHSMNIHS